MDGTKELKWFGGLLAILFLAWLISGGPDRYSEEDDKPFIKPPTPLDTGEVYGPESEVESVFVPLGWEAVATDHFFIALPQGWTFHESETSVWTSYRGEFTNGGTILFFEYGPNATLPIEETDDRYRVTHELIAGYDAVLIEPKTFTGNATALFIDRAPLDAKLSIIGYNLSPTMENIAFSIFRTIQFRD